MARIELLNARHCRDGFDCGEPALNDFLLRQAGQQQRRGFGKNYVAVSVVDMAVLGFVTVSAAQVATYQLPAHLKLPRYPVPMLRIGRLAVSRIHQGQGIGQDLLAFALNLALEFSHRVGLYAVVVDAKNEKAGAFYAGLGFQACEDNPLCLYMPVAVLERATRPNSTG